jgi:glycosyltransferase involved in cell wall biosynthesis
MEKALITPPLFDTSLCAIVRDEKMNPAGGIERFVDSIVPYVEQAVIADTGSVDGTRQILEEMQAKYSNLKVVDIPFKGYADARNKAKEHVQTRRLLVLDADELLTHETPRNDWEILKRILERHLSSAYNFDFLAVSPAGFYKQSNVHPTRLFDNLKDFEFVRESFECLLYKKKMYLPNLFSIRPSVLQIKHFVPSEEGNKLKYSNWYNSCAYRDTSPSKSEGFANWKAFNPRRDEFI